MLEISITEIPVHLLNKKKRTFDCRFLNNCSQFAASSGRSQRQGGCRPLSPWEREVVTQRCSHMLRCHRCNKKDGDKHDCSSYIKKASPSLKIYKENKFYTPNFKNWRKVVKMQQLNMNDGYLRKWSLLWLRDIFGRF